MTTIAASQDVAVREEIISIPKKVFDYSVSKLKHDDGKYRELCIEGCSGVNLGKLTELSVIKFGTAMGVIGHQRDKDFSKLILWVYPYCDSSYKIEISCGFFRDFSSNILSIYEKIHVSFPTFGLTLLNPDQINIISVVLDGLRIVTPSETFRRVK